MDREPGLWEHDAWERIYAIPDGSTKIAVAHLYRLILDMRESDVLAQKIAAAVNKERRLALTLVQKSFVLLFSLVLATDTAVHLYQSLHP